MKAGIYTVQTICEALGFNISEIKDYRRVKIGGLGFDYLEQKMSIPETAAEITITVDGDVAATQEVEA